jgi:ribosomal protein S15P/S13E
MEKPSQRAVTAAVKPPVNVKKLTRQLAGIMAHLEQHPTDALSKARVAKINELLRNA